MSQATTNRDEQKDLQDAITRAEDTLAQLAQDVGGRARGELRDRALDAIEHLSESAARLRVHGIGDAVARADDFANRNPVAASAIGMALGVILGLAVQKTFSSLLPGVPTTLPPPPIIRRKRKT